MALNPRFQRLALLTGAGALDALASKRVMVFGAGGVGSWCAEALVRSGIGRIDLVDSDTVCVTNINRQIQATTETIGQYKTEVLKKRLLEINPDCDVRAYGRVFSRESSADFDIAGASYVIDAIDSLSHKLDLIEISVNAGVVLYSSMGMAQKLDPTRIKTADIWETAGCPLARLVRQGLKKRGFSGHFSAVYSDERLPLKQESVGCGTSQCLCPAKKFCPENNGEGGAENNGVAPVEWCSSKKVINGSAVTVTAAAGLVLASLVIRSVCSRFGVEA